MLNCSDVQVYNKWIKPYSLERPKPLSPDPEYFVLFDTC